MLSSYFSSYWYLCGICKHGNRRVVKVRHRRCLDLTFPLPDLFFFPLLCRSFSQSRSFSSLSLSASFSISLSVFLHQSMTFVYCLVLSFTLHVFLSLPLMFTDDSKEMWSGFAKRTIMRRRFRPSLLSLFLEAGRLKQNCGWHEMNEWMGKENKEDYGIQRKKVEIQEDR